MGLNLYQVLKPIEINVEIMQRLLPHRDIALKVLDEAFYDPTVNSDEIFAYKKTIPEDPYFIGHFPDNPTFPGHWQFEAMCLTAALLYKSKFPCVIGTPVIIGTDGKMRFNRPVKPGENLKIHAKIIDEKSARGSVQFHFSIKISRESDGKVVSFVERLIGGISS